MKITKVTLQTSKLEEMVYFYHHSLQMSLMERTTHSFAVSAGRTILAFEQTEEKPFYHFALGVAEAAFDRYAARIKEVAPILTSKEGEEIMRSYMWKGRQLYFEDPEKNILEILSFPSETGKEWLGVQEVGIPVPDIAQFASGLSPLETEFSAESDSFCFYGDQEGVFVLVKEKRPWYPTDRAASINPISIELAHPSGFVSDFAKQNLPYHVVSVSK
ncbi:VOC family protein [Brevibacillus sp. NRS-1366]|uniref:VOC family protein n=1 Tax=Brevibacillus sp. NRS-1366 TaxID=3233899 RepID=UPI003D1F6762